MERTLHVFVVPNGQLPAWPPKPARALTVEAPSLDGLREAAWEKLAAEGCGSEQERPVRRGPRRRPERI